MPDRTAAASAVRILSGTATVIPTTVQPVAVFDSGIGGLTVVRALRDCLPHEDIVYFGDTARVPYGTKTRETVTRFTLENCAFLMRMAPKCIVAACHTVSAVAVPSIAGEFPVPLIGVVGPGADAAVRACGPRDLIAVAATEATVRSNAYKNAIAAIDAGRPVVQAACPLFVPLAEEGIDAADPIVRLAVSRYLGPVRRLSPAAMVLGCTHYPMLRDAIGEFFDGGVTLIDPAASTAQIVERTLRAMNALSPSGGRGSLHCYVSDDPSRFQVLGSRFLGEPIPDVVRVCPDELGIAAGDAVVAAACRRA
jgi:glutamate racemase